MEGRFFLELINLQPYNPRRIKGRVKKGPLWEIKLRVFPQFEERAPREFKGEKEGKGIFKGKEKKKEKGPNFPPPNSQKLKP